MTDLVTIRGLLRKKFPTIENGILNFYVWKFKIDYKSNLFLPTPFTGRLAVNLPQLVEALRKGVKYEAKRDDFQLDYGWIDVTIGNVSIISVHK